MFMFTLLYSIIRCIHPISSSLANNSVTRCHHQCPRLCLDITIKWHCRVICALAKTYLWKFQFEHLHETTASCGSHQIKPVLSGIVLSPVILHTFLLPICEELLWTQHHSIFTIFLGFLYEVVHPQAKQCWTFTRVICNMLWQIVSCMHVSGKGA